MVKSERLLTSGIANVRPSFGITNSVPALQTAQDVIAFSGNSRSSDRMDDCLPFKKNDPVSGLKESQLSMTLTALRHDHPMIVSIDSTTSASSAGLQQQMQMLRDRKRPVIGSPFPPNPLSSSPHPSDHFRTEFEAKRSCLPYGFYYDTEDMIEMIEDRIGWKSNGIDWDDDMDEMMPSPISDDCYYLTSEQKHFKQTKDSGPTLAQLNLMDTFDVDDLLSSSPMFIAAAIAGRSRISFTQSLEQPPVKQQMHHHQQLHDVTPSRHRSVSRHHEAQVNILSETPAAAATNPVKNLQTKHHQHQDRPASREARAVTIPVNDNLPPALLSIKSIPPACEPSVIVKHEVIGDQKTGHTTSKSSHQLNRAASCNESLPTQTSSSSSSSSSSPVNDVAMSKSVKSETSSGAKVAHSPCKSQSPRARNSSMCTEGSVSSHDEGFASQVEEEDSDDEEEVEDSDDESFYGDYEAKDLLGASTSDDVTNRWALNMGRSRKGGLQRFFWQYNVQSKGPKGSRIPAAAVATAGEAADPHVLAEAKDPVFSPECRIEGVKHAGKARRGDGNDLTPNPKKLLMIGLELKKLSKTINDLTPVAEVPVNARNKTRKEKNKLASRACRLKKKAQHEANKIKLFGLQQEHRKTMLILKEIRKRVRQTHESRTHSSKSRYIPCIDQAVAEQGDFTLVAGRTAEFVNSILDNVSAGQTDGGLKAF